MPNENEIDNGVALDSVQDVGTESGSTSVSQQTQPSDAFTLDEIQSTLGKKFESKESALKAIKDTFSYVGRKQEDAAKLAESNLTGSGEYVRRSEIETEFFYRDNESAAKHRSLVDAVAKANNISPREAAALPDVKKLLDAASAQDEAEAAKTVIQSNPRLATSRDRLTEAQKLMASGDKSAAGAAATQAVREAYGF